MNETLSTVAGRPTLRIERRLAHPPEKVWRAITEPAQLSQWYPFQVEQMDLRVGGMIHFDDGAGMKMDAIIMELDPPRVFAFSERAPEQMERESEDLIHFELRPDGTGCLLIFTHTFDDRPAAASYASGWTVCLDGLESILDEKPVEMATDRWAELHEGYVERFGLLEGTVSETEDGYLVRFERQMIRPVDAVWSLLASSGEGESQVGGSPPLAFTNGYVPAGPITAVESPKLLEYEWSAEGSAAGRVRWEFSNGPGGARLVLSQTIPTEHADQRATALAAWHTHLELLADHLRDRPRCWPEGRTEALAAEYAQRLERLER